ncbi:MAG: hypothetical protein OS112_10155 [Methanoregula sp.]|nr:MAG: hypothetical protein OS112_10155 [Methanoregula sp.]
MGFVISSIIWMLTFLRVVFAILLASFGISTLLASFSRLLFEPASSDLMAVASWFARPLIIGIIMIIVAYWISKTLTRVQKMVITFFVFILSIILFFLLVSGMGWFTGSVANDISVFAAPVNTLNDINNMSRVLTGV